MVLCPFQVHLLFSAHPVYFNVTPKFQFLMPSNLARSWCLFSYLALCLVELAVCLREPTTQLIAYLLNVSVGNMKQAFLSFLCCGWVISQLSVTLKVWLDSEASPCPDFLWCWGRFLDMFAKLQKGPISFIISVCVEQLSSHWMDFCEILYLSIFKNLTRKFKFH
jgi:hypothetical protein